MLNSRTLCSLAMLCLLSTTTIAQSSDKNVDAYTISTMRIDGTALAIVKLQMTTGYVWLLDKDEWIELAPPKNLPESKYDCSLAPVGKKTWILTLWDTASGDTYIYSSATKGWRFTRNREKE
ncbi:MAG: hypothetical protein OSB41_00355 [Kiritimatiellae bacterium]|nr:hypothetical protein [Kiritimatiellia bacterium]